jgi:tetratricopeptide (TPR) repeat protein
MNAGDDYLTENNVEAALKEYTTAMNIYPGNPEMIFWPAVTMAASGKVEESLPLFKKVFQQDTRWAELLKRLPKVNQFPKDEALMKKILSLVPKKK